MGNPGLNVLRSLLRHARLLAVAVACLPLPLLAQSTNWLPITIQPLSQSVLPGSDVTLSVTVTGAIPYSFAWQFDGTNIPVATNSTYAIVDMNSNLAGAYTVVVSNSIGSLVSSQALLYVAAPPDFLWIQSALSYGYDSYWLGGSAVQGVATDPAGNVYGAGARLSESLTFEDFVMTNTPAGPNGSYFICKYDSAGNFLWADEAGGTNGYGPVRLVTDSSGNVLIAAAFAGAAVFGTNVLHSVTPADAFLAKYNPQGQLLWVRQINAYDTNWGLEFSDYYVDNLITLH